MRFYVYIVECSDGSFYCGYTNNLEKRIHDHNNEKIGAKYTKTRRPVYLKYYEEFLDKKTALKREFEIKKMKRSQKINLIIPTS